jgi:hypothetical protein
MHKMVIGDDTPLPGTFDIDVRSSKSSRLCIRWSSGMIDFWVGFIARRLDESRKACFLPVCFQELLESQCTQNRRFMLGHQIVPPCQFIWAAPDSKTNEKRGHTTCSPQNAYMTNKKKPDRQCKHLTDDAPQCFWRFAGGSGATDRSLFLAKGLLSS